MKKTKQEYEALLKNPNVQKGLALLRFTEGTDQYADPYSTAFGGKQYDITKGHPNILTGFSTKSKGKQKSSAAGAYQFLKGTWDEVSKKYNLQEMSQQNQDIAALALIDRRGGLAPLVSGDVKTFVKKTNKEWASLPGSPYGQPVKKMNDITSFWNSQDGGLPSSNLPASPNMAFNDAGLPAGLDVPIPHGYVTPTTQASTGSLSPFDAVMNKKPTEKDKKRMDPLDYANTMLGRGERPDNKMLSSFLSDGGKKLDPAETAWCAAFVNSSVSKAGYKGTGKLNARSYLDWGQGVDNPQKGDIAVFSRGDPNGWQGHVGFFEGFDKKGNPIVLGGNQGSRGEVSKKPYSKSKLLGYRRGAYDMPTPAPTPSDYGSFRNESQTYAAPRGNVERGGNLPAPIDQDTNLYGASPSDYANYQSSNRSSAMPRGDVAPKPSFRPQVSQPESLSPFPTSMRGAPSRTQPQTAAMPVSMPAPKPAYQPKASDYSNYMMQAPVKTQPEYAPKASDYSNYMGSNRTSGLPTGADIPIPADMPQLPQTTIAGPIGQPMAGIPIPAPRPTKIDRFKQKAGSKLKEHFKPQTVAARMAGGLIGGPMGAMAGPKIAQFINQRGFKGNGLSMPKFGSRQPINQFQAQGNNSSNRMQNAMTGPRGATNTASNGSQATSLGNGQYTYYSPKSGKTSVKGDINMNKSADLKSFFGN